MIMKSLCFLIVCLVLLVNCQTGQDLEREKQNVESTVIDFFNAVSEFNYQEMEDHCTDDFMLVEFGQFWKVDSLVSLLKPSEGKSRMVYGFTDFVTHMEGSVGWTSYRNTGVRTAGEEKTDYEWLESAVLKKKEGMWKIALLHSTRIKP